MSRAVLIRRATWVLAAVSLAVGVWRSMAPEAALDFTRVMAWAQTLLDGVSPWAGDSDADYPPWAVVTLTPLLVLPVAARLPAWITINVGLALWLAVALTRSPREDDDVRRGLIALLLSSSAFRVLGQFSIVSFSLAWAGVTDRVPWRGGVWLGLALMKPHVGGVLWLAHLLRGDWVRVGVAAVVPVALVVLSAGWLGMTPLAVIAEYRHALELVQGGDAWFSGHTELEPWIAGWFPSVTTVTGTFVLGMTLLLPVATLGRRLPTLEFYALCGALSLLTVRHLSYDLLLLLPLMVAWRTWPYGTAHVRQPWPSAWVLLSIWMVAQPLGWWRRVVEPMGLAEAGHWILDLDRVLCLTVFSLLLWRCMRLDVTK